MTWPETQLNSELKASAKVEASYYMMSARELRMYLKDYSTTSTYLLRAIEGER